MIMIATFVRDLLGAPPIALYVVERVYLDPRDIHICQEEVLHVPSMSLHVISGAALPAQPFGTRSVNHAGGLWQCSTSGT
jgi:hypothetical protein